MKKILRECVALMLVIMGGNLFAQIPNGYYNNAEDKTGDELKVALHNIIKGHHEVSYSGLLNAFAYTDLKPNGKIWDIYSNVEYSLNSGVCGEYQQEGDCWNREHTWPQSWFNEQTTPRSDLFHVYPTDGYVNGQRSNYPYGEVNHPIYTSGNGSKLGPCVTSGYSGRVFEPIDEYKGDIARGYFYMSVRYYTEDDGWGSSDMTSKSEILPWAMTMLLQWSDQDPVSQKEIDRNNAVYGYQGNRNPFIDHPEYAHLIWDPGWEGTPYAITCNSAVHGSISAPATAVAGTLVTLTATPNPGYEIDTWTVAKTGDASTTIAVNNNTFVMPNFPVTVSATFKANNTYYYISQGTVSHGTVSVSTTSARSGTTITLTSTPASGYSLYAWYVYKTDDINTRVPVSTTGNLGSFVMPAFDVTVLASFAQGSDDGDYVKVTTAPSDWSGEYILVYENSTTQGYVWTGVDAANCYVAKTISNHTIADDGFVTLTLAPMSGGYSIKVNGGANNGKYISGNANSNTISFGTTAKLNTLEFEANGIKITSNTSVMRYNKNSSDNRFRYYKSGSYTSQQPVQLYKKTAGSVTVPTHTIRFYPNGGSPSNYVQQTVTEFEPTALQANTFVRPGYVFDSWNTQADGSGTSYFDGATVSLFNDLTLYAQWLPVYTVTCATDIEHGSISASPTSTVEGDMVTLTATPESGYDLDSWTVTDANDQPVALEGNQFAMPASNVTVSATFVYVGQPYMQKYYRITDASQLEDGRVYLIVNVNSGKALGKTQNPNNRSAASVSIGNNTIASIGNEVCELVLGQEDGLWTFFDPNASGYLYAASSSNNHLKTQTENDANGQWSITFANNGVATIQAQGTNTRNLLKYNSQSNIFSCYSSGMQDVYLFVRSTEFDHEESTVLACLNSFDRHTVHSGVVVTANKVLGMSQCNNAGQIVIEPGAQLVHNVTGLNATLKKHIAAYTDDGGWYTIAVPFGSYAPSGGMTANNYDLYAYNDAVDSSGKEWVNYKPNGTFNLSAGEGYLYARHPATTLRMVGTLNSGSYTQTVSLDYANSDASIKGFNLLGNPTAHEISYTASSGVADGYYYLSNSESWTYTVSNTVPVGRGFLVKANTEGQTVTLNPQSRSAVEALCSSSHAASYLCLQIGAAQVYVKLGEGVSMPMLSFKGRHASLYFMRDHQPYVMLVRDGADALDLSYEPKQAGRVSLVADAEGLTLDYLHLVDLKTGDDVDLLSTPVYDFDADPTDAASRFVLRFVP